MPDGDEGTVTVLSEASTAQAPTTEPRADAIQLPDVDDLPFLDASPDAPADPSNLLPTPVQADALPHEDGSGTPRTPPAPPPEPPPGQAGAELAKILAEVEDLLAKAAELYPSPPEEKAPAPPAPPSEAEDQFELPRPPANEGAPEATYATMADAQVKRVRTKRTKRELAAEAVAKRREARRRLALLGLVLVLSSVVSPLLSAASPSHAYTIASDSMAPTMPRGSFVLASPGEVHVHDVIVYESRLTNSLQVHRIVEIRHEDSNTKYLVRGDHNDEPDSILVNPSDVKGVVRFNMPGVGYLWLLPPKVQIGVFVLFIATYVGITAWDAREGMGRRKTAVVATGLILLLATPFTSASVQPPAYPGSAHGAGLVATPLAMSAGNETQVPVTTADGGNKATATVRAPQLWKEYNLWVCTTSTSATCKQDVTTTTYTLQAKSLQRIDAANFTPAPKFWLELDGKAAAGQNISVKLRDITNGAWVANAVVDTTSTTYALTRSTNSFALSGTTDYEFGVRVSGGTGSYLQVRLLYMQQEPTKSETSIPVAFESTSVTDTLNFHQVSSTALWTPDKSKTDGTVTARFEITADQSGTPVSNSQVKLGTGANCGTTTVVTLTLANGASTQRRSSNDIWASLTEGTDYVVCAEAGAGVGTSVTVHGARIVVEQSNYAKTVNYVLLSGGQTATTATAAGTRGFDGRFQAISLYQWTPKYFESTMQHVTGTVDARLYDNSTATTVTTVSTTSATLVRMRSTDFALTGNDSYSLQIDSQAGTTATFTNAWIVSFVDVTFGRRYDYAVSATTPGSSSCASWTFTLAKSSPTATPTGMRNLTIALKTGSTVQNQIVYDGSSWTSSEGAAITVSSSTQFKQLVYTNPSTSATNTVTADLKGNCGGVHTVQKVTYTFQN